MTPKDTFFKALNNGSCFARLGGDSNQVLDMIKSATDILKTAQQKCNHIWINDYGVFVCETCMILRSDNEM